MAPGSPEEQAIRVSTCVGMGVYVCVCVCVCVKHTLSTACV